MKKIIISSLVLFAVPALKAQHSKLNSLIDKLESKKYSGENLKNVDINNKKFSIVKNFDDHTERLFITINGSHATFVEVFEDKANGQTSSNVFTGDVMRTPQNVLSFRFDRLEGKKIALPMVKTFKMLKQKNMLYLIDVNNKEQWSAVVSDK